MLITNLLIDKTHQWSSISHIEHDNSIVMFLCYKYNDLVTFHFMDLFESDTNVTDNSLHMNLLARKLILFHTLLIQSIIFSDPYYRFDRLPT